METFRAKEPKRLVQTKRKGPFKMSANRMHQRDTVHFVTNRCEHEMFLLLPTATITKIIQGWFARAVCKYGDGLEIYAFIFLSNHFHILYKDTKGYLAAFMWYFQGNVARAINRELGRKGRFWSREYDDVIVDGEDDFWDRYGYVVGNAVKSGLVDKAEDWPGWRSLDGALTGEEYEFELFNRTRYHNATRRGQKKNRADFNDVWRFKLATPPALQDKNIQERKDHIREVLKTAEAKFKKDRNNKRPLGAKKILMQRPLDRPQNPSFRPRVKFCCSDDERRKELKDGYRIFVGGYRTIFDSYRKASAERKRPTVEWPVGSFPPSCLYPVSRNKAA